MYYFWYPHYGEVGGLTSDEVMEPSREVTRSSGEGSWNPRQPGRCPLLPLRFEIGCFQSGIIISFVLIIANEQFVFEGCKVICNTYSSDEKSSRLQVYME